jgi:hypothetical protein
MSEKSFLIDLNKWNMAAFRAFIAASKDDKWEDIFPLLALVVIEWPFKGVVSTETFEAMGLEDLAATLNAVKKAIQNAFAEGN